MKNVNNSTFWKYLIVICVCAAFFASNTKAQIASGGNYTLTQTAIANGGASGNVASIGGTYSIEGTLGQNAAGTIQQTGSYGFQPGFWTVQVFAPTAANVSVSGRVITANGNGIRNVQVILTTGNGETRAVTSSTFGYFRFDDVPSGETYIFRVVAKKYSFAQPTQVRWIAENVSDLFFIGNE